MRKVAVLSAFAMVTLISISPALSSGPRAADAAAFGGPHYDIGPPVPAERLPDVMPRPGQRTASAKLPGWSGYAVTARKGVRLSQIFVQFTVPAVNCYSSSPGADGAWLSEWAGIDGYGSATVEQAGVDAYCATKTSPPRYYGWYEMYPRAATIRIGVNPGDDVTVRISRHADGRYRLTLRDVSDGVGFSILRPCPSGSACKAASAEAIIETPYKHGYLPLADYAAMTFANATVQGNLGSDRGTLAAGKYWTSTPIDMVSSGGTLESVPGPLEGGSDFTLTWKRS